MEISYIQNSIVFVRSGKTYVYVDTYIFELKRQAFEYIQETFSNFGKIHKCEILMSLKSVEQLLKFSLPLSTNDTAVSLNTVSGLTYVLLQDIAGRFHKPEHLDAFKVVIPIISGNMIQILLQQNPGNKLSRLIRYFYPNLI